MKNKIEFKESIVAFIDILGFKQEILDCNNDSTKLEEKYNIYINKLKSAEYFIVNKNHINNSNRNYISFSDSNIIYWELKHPESDNEIGGTISDLCKYQYQLALEGIFVRGGISRGLNYMEDNIIFGESIIKSHDLESKEAIYPRIILDNSLNNILQKFAEKTTNDNEFWKQSLLKDYDGYYFINYLNELLDLDKFCNSPEIKKELSKDPVIENLKIHKLHIEKNLNKYNLDNKIYSKFIWVAQYHNWFCNKHYFNSIEFLININDREFFDIFE